jgi:hypothetical protein
MKIVVFAGCLWCDRARSLWSVDNSVYWKNKVFVYFVVYKNLNIHCDRARSQSRSPNLRGFFELLVVSIMFFLLRTHNNISLCFPLQFLLLIKYNYCEYIETFWEI